MTGDQAPKTILLASPRGFCAGAVQTLGAAEVRELQAVREEVSFPLPPEVALVREAAGSALAHS